MKKNIIICGVGGQGILTISRILVTSTLKQGLNFKQAEVHGMSQRGGTVYAHLRLSNKRIFSPIIPIGKADLVLAMEPLEALRHAHFLKEKGRLVSSTTKLSNIAYNEKPVLKEIKRLNGVLVDSRDLAVKAGNPLAENMALLGASTKEIGLKQETLMESIQKLFTPKGKKVVEANLKAFELGVKTRQ